MTFGGGISGNQETPPKSAPEPGFHKANYDHDNDRFQAKTKQLM